MPFANCAQQAGRIKPCPASTHPEFNLFRSSRLGESEHAVTESNLTPFRFQYLVYGLSVALPFPLPGLIPRPNDTAADIIIRFGDVPVGLERIEAAGARFQAAPGKLLAWVDGVGRYLVLNGREIVIHPAPEAQEDDVRVLLLGSPFGALLHQRGMLLVHASVVATEQGAILLMGTSGVGKSSLAALLSRRGFHCLSDDIAAVTIDPNGTPRVHPGLPQLHLWPDVLSTLGESLDSLVRLRPKIGKRTLPLGDRFTANSQPIARIYHLETDGKSSELSLSALGPAKKVEALVDQTYRTEFLKGLGVRAAHFSLVARTAAKVPVFRLVRPDDEKLRLTEVADFLIQHLSP